MRLLKAIGDNAALIELKGTKEQALSILQEVQRDPMTDRYLHVDLHEVKADEKMEINVPVHTSGESTGVKNEAGVLEATSHTLRIRCLPKDLPAFIDVDVTELHVGQTIHIRELKPVPGVVFLGDKNQPVVSCVQPVEEIVEAVVETAVPAEGVPAEGATAEGAPPALLPPGPPPCGAVPSPVPRRPPEPNPVSGRRWSQCAPGCGRSGAPAARCGRQAGSADKKAPHGKK